MGYRIRMGCLAVLLAAAAAGCAGGGGGSEGVASISGATTTTTTGGAGGNRGGDPTKQLLEYARCMRAHGVDMPDPKVDGKGRAEFQMRGDPNSPKHKAAVEACKDKMPRGPAGEGPGRNDPKLQEAALEFAKCMRQHGVSKFPDPQPGGGLLIGPDSGVDPGSPTFKAAEKACQPIMEKVAPAAERGVSG
jgi:hypothetical protein